MWKSSVLPKLSFLLCVLWPLTSQCLSCVCSDTSAWRQGGRCGVWPAVWPEVWHQSGHGCQAASHLDWDGEVCVFALQKAFAMLLCVFLIIYWPILPNLSVILSSYLIKLLPILPICFVWRFLFRVLCVGGTLVLLLSPQLSCLLKKLLEENHIESSSKHESEPRAGPHSCPPPPPVSARRDTLQMNEEIHSSATKGAGHRAALPTFQFSLKLQETFRVSLGLIDGIIHKYVKINTWFFFFRWCYLGFIYFYKAKCILIT